MAPAPDEQVPPADLNTCSVCPTDRAISVRKRNQQLPGSTIRATLRPAGRLVATLPWPADRRMRFLRGLPGSPVGAWDVPRFRGPVRALEPWRSCRAPAWGTATDAAGVGA